jgi:hypothetical protein
MNQDLYPRSRSGCGILSVIGWLLAVALGVALLWYGFAGSGGPTDGEPVSVDETPAQTTDEATPTPEDGFAWPTVTPLPPTATPTPDVTDTPIPSPTSEPTPIPPTETPATIVAGADGVNVRQGPGTNFTRLGYLEPGAQATLIGRYEDWWQIEYEGSPAWVFGDLVTASNADNVPQVQPPASPVPPTAAPATEAPPAPEPTDTPPPSEPSDYRGIVPENFEVEGAPGPYAQDADIWFHMWIHNSNPHTVEYESVGVLVEETGQFQKSWIYSSFSPGQKFHHRDRINQFDLGPGTYHLWMTICFTDGECFKMMGPIQVIVQ